MFKKTRKILSLFLSVVLLSVATLQPLSAALAPEPDVELQWQNVYNVVLTINPTDPMKVSATVSGYSGTTYSNGVISLKKTSDTGTSLIQMWNYLSGSSSTFDFNGTTAHTPSAGTYVLKITITATRNNVSETITSSTEVTLS